MAGDTAASMPLFSGKIGHDGYSGQVFTRRPISSKNTPSWRDWRVTTPALACVACSALVAAICGMLPVQLSRDPWDFSMGPTHAALHENTSQSKSMLPLLPPFTSLAVIEPLVWTLKYSNGNEKVKSTFCCCAKCGSTSVVNALYEILLGKQWSYTDRPWPQTLNSSRWEGAATQKVNWDSFEEPSYAIIRDPKDRIMSAFRSKISCSGAVDLNDRKAYVPKLLELAGLSAELASKPLYGDGLCLKEAVYLEALFMVHKKQLQGKLNIHFRPQNIDCFLHAPPSQWTVVTTVRSPKARCQLESIVSSNNSTGENCSYGTSHGTTREARDVLSVMDKARLAAITREEYQVLGPYLP